MKYVVVNVLKNDPTNRWPLETFDSYEEAEKLQEKLEELRRPNPKNWATYIAIDG